MRERPQGRGYVRLRGTPNHPWGGMAGVEVAAHEFHYSALEGLSSHLDFGYRVERGFGVDGRNDGIIYRNLLANYSHMRDTGRNRWTQRFVDYVRAHRPGGRGQ
jgi:cobyrinic acid a,c-diamide synthase